MHNPLSAFLLVDGNPDHEIGRYDGQRKVVALINTHAHFDHSGHIPFLKEHYNLEWWLHKDDFFLQSLAQESGKRWGFSIPEPAIAENTWENGDKHEFGGMLFEIIHTPGHTPACLTYIIGDAAFVGDTLFMPDFGTARCDFPGGSSTTMFHSIQKILSLPDETRIFVGHDYKSPERDEFAWETTVRDQKEKNIHIKVGKSKEDFVKMRDERDKKLNMPKLIIPSLQVNMRAGNMPDPDDQGNTYIKVPVNKL